MRIGHVEITYSSAQMREKTWLESACSEGFQRMNICRLKKENVQMDTESKSLEEDM